LTGMVPQLEYDGIPLGETNAIVSFLGKEFQLAGTGNIEQARCEMVANLIGDFIGKGAKMRVETDEEKKKVMMAEYLEKTVPQFMEMMVKLLQANNGKNLVGSGVTYADIILACLFDSISNFDPQFASIKLPDPLEDLNKMIREHPKIKTWLEKRPSTPF